MKAQILLATIVSHVCCDEASMQAGLKLAQNKPGIVLDVGANGGRETTIALEHNREVFAVECLAKAYQLLLNTFGAAKNVTLIHACAGEKTEVKTLHLADDSSSLIEKNVESGKELEKAMRPHNRRRNIEHVVVVPLDNLVTKPVALMKIDVQGYESEVIKGARQILSTYKPILVYEAMTPHFSKTKVDIPAGYTCYTDRIDRVCY
jgi:FkbM family methyltransferase